MIGYKFRVIPFYIQCNPFYWVVGCFFCLKQYFPHQFHISLHRNLLFESPAIILPLASQGHKSDLSVSQDSRKGFEEHLAENVRLGSMERPNQRTFCCENNNLESCQSSPPTGT